MVKHCCVPACASESYGGCNITFHSFPKNEEMRQKWLKNLGITKNLGKTACVCGFHFEPTCYSNSPYNTLRILKKDAVPTIITVPKNDIKAILSNIVLVPQHQVSSHVGQSPSTSMETPPSLLMKEKSPESKLCLVKEVGTQTTMKFTSDRETILQKRVKHLQQRLSRRENKLKNLQSLLISLLMKKRKDLDEL